MEWWQYALLWGCVSWLLWRFPLWRKKLNRTGLSETKKWVVAHRGGSAEQPENTLEAFRNAANLGCDILEMDVQCTKDGVIVISHDNNLKRVTGQSVLISELNYQDLPVFAKEFFTHFIDEKCVFDDGKQHKIPTLEEVFREFPTKVMCIDIKDPTHYTITATVSLIRRFHRENSTYLGSFSEAGQKAIKREYPDGLTFMSQRRIACMYLAYFVGLIGLFPVYEDVVWMAILTPKFERELRTEFPPVRRLLMCLFFRLRFALTAPLNAHMQRRGVKVVYWVLNEPQDYALALSVPCDGIVTDRPKALAEYLRQK